MPLHERHRCWPEWGHVPASGNRLQRQWNSHVGASSHFGRRPDSPIWALQLCRCRNIRVHDYSMWARICATTMHCNWNNHIPGLHVCQLPYFAHRRFAGPSATGFVYLGRHQSSQVSEELAVALSQLSWEYVNLRQQKLLFYGVRGFMKGQKFRLRGNLDWRDGCS